MMRRRLLVAGAAIVILGLHLAVVSHRRADQPGDFDVSREFGRRFVERTWLYAGGTHYVYQPAAAMFFAPLSLLPAHVAFGMRYAAAVACLWWLLRLLNRLAGRGQPGVRQREVTIALGVLLLGSHYVIRDLDDGGPHLILIAFAVAGLAASAGGRTARGACLLGLVAAVKPPYALLLAYFAWTRQWRLTGAFATAVIVWSVAPAVWMGLPAWWAHERAWVGEVVSGPRASEMRPQNLGLRATVLRYVSPGSMSVESPDGGSAVRGDVREPAAKLGRPSPVGELTAVLLQLLIVAGVFLAVPRARGAPGDLSWVRGASAVLILSALLSPVTWVQHLVVALPALYLIVAEHVGSRRPGTGAVAAMIVYAILTLVFNREILGRELYVWLMAHGLHAVALLLLIGVLLRPRTTMSLPGGEDGDPTGPRWSTGLP